MQAYIFKIRLLTLKFSSSNLYQFKIYNIFNLDAFLKKLLINQIMFWRRILKREVFFIMSI